MKEKTSKTLDRLVGHFGLLADYPHDDFHAWSKRSDKHKEKKEKDDEPLSHSLFLKLQCSTFLSTPNR